MILLVWTMDGDVMFVHCVDSFDQWMWAAGGDTTQSASYYSQRCHSSQQTLLPGEFICLLLYWFRRKYIYILSVNRYAYQYVFRQQYFPYIYLFVVCFISDFRRGWCIGGILYSSGKAVTTFRVSSLIIPVECRVLYFFFLKTQSITSMN